MRRGFASHREDRTSAFSASICIQSHQKWRAFHRSSENFNSLLEPTDVTRGRMRRELAKKIAQSQAQVQPTEDDLAIAFMRACQAQNAVDDAAQQTGDYRPKRFNG